MNQLQITILGVVYFFPAPSGNRDISSMHLKRYPVLLVVGARRTVGTSPLVFVKSLVNSDPASAELSLWYIGRGCNSLSS